LSGNFKITFEPSGRGKAREAPDPAYPHGIAIDAARGRTSCTAELPYPAPECGYYLIECQMCYLRVAITAAGRPDDPISATLPCKITTRGGVA